MDQIIGPNCGHNLGHFDETVHYCLGGENQDRNTLST